SLNNEVMWYGLHYSRKGSINRTWAQLFDQGLIYFVKGSINLARAPLFIQGLYYFIKGSINRTRAQLSRQGLHYRRKQIEIGTRKGCRFSREKVFMNDVIHF